MSSVTDAFMIDEGVNHNGTRERLHVNGGTVVHEKTYDAAPHLEYAAKAREATEGQNWGSGRLIGHIPPAQYAQFLLIRDNQERKKAIRTWLKANPAFVMFDKYLK